MEQIPYHQHTGNDSPQIDPTDLLGYQVLSAVPTYTAKQGEMVFVDDKSTIRRLYVYLNGTWRYTNLT